MTRCIHLKIKLGKKNAFHVQLSGASLKHASSTDTLEAKKETESNISDYIKGPRGIKRFIDQHYMAKGTLPCLVN